MLSRALSLAAVALLMAGFAAPSAWAQAQNLEAGKSPSQLFAGTCNACHKSPRGLLKTVSAGSLPGFLREHYTTSSDMAAQLSTFLISNGASDTRSQARQGADAKPAGGAADQADRQGRKMRPPQEAARPGADEPAPQGRNAKRTARPGEAPDAAKPATDGQVPARAAIERGPDGRKLTSKQGLSKRGRPGEELPTAKEEPPKLEPPMDEKAKAETAKEGDAKPEEAKPAGEGKSEAARMEIPKSGGGEMPVLRPDPVPPVTPAPPPSAPKAAADTAATRPSPPPPEPPPAVTASAPPPAAAAGPPAPPISQ
ncbi:MAG TPA: hypothetical protein VKS24_05000 [Bradyrhizobium sp.]|nr:hypothetical protein [Bradyrhizobium sp.]